MSFFAKVGSFTKATGAATVSQSLTGFGFQPKALILLTATETTLATAGQTGYSTFVGITDGTTSKSWGFAGGISGLSQVGKQRRASKALTICNNLGTLLAECDLTSFDSDGITLSWTTNDANAYYIGYLALGGSDLTAKVLQWQQPASSGSFSVTGAGFQPTGMFTIGAGYTTAPTSTDTHAELALGAIADGDTAWAMDMVSFDAFGTTSCQHHQRTAADVLFSGTGTLASFTSFDSDGFTFNYSAVDARRYRASLLLGGVSFRSGKFTHSNGAAPASQTITFTTSGSVDLTWNPNNTGDNGPIMYFASPGKFALFAGMDQTADGTVSNDTPLSIGLTDGTNHFFTAVAQRSGNSSSAAGNHYVNTKVYGDHLSGGPMAPSSIVSAVSLVALTSYTLTGGQGSYSLTGEAAAFAVARRLAAAQGAYALTGEDVAFIVGAGFVVAQGSYVVNGQTATLSRVRKLLADVGYYDVTGEGVFFTRGKLSETGYYNLTGESDVADLHLNAVPVLYVVNGQVADGFLSGTIVMPGDTGNGGNVGGQDADLLLSTRMRLQMLGPNLRRK